MADKSLKFLLFGEDKTAGGVFGALGVHAEGVSGAISGSFRKMGTTIGGEFGELMGKAGEVFETFSEKASAGQKLLAGGGVLTGVGGALQMLASGEQQASDQLKQAIDNTGASYDEFEGKIEGAVKAQEGFGHGAQDTKAALQKMTQALGDPQKALDNLGLVANLAAAKHISLSDAADKVDKILAGKGGRTLAEYGITMGKGKDKTAEAQAALEQLSKKIDGQAAASMDNFGAKVGAARTTLGDLAAGVAGTLGPALTAVGPLLMVVGTAMEIVTARRAASAAAAAAEAAATEAETVATGEATVAQTGLNLAFLANPVVLIVAGIVALVAAVVLAYNKVGWFHALVDTAFHGIAVAVGWMKDAAVKVFDWVKDHWQLVLGFIIGPVGLAVAWVVTHFDQIRAGAALVIGGLRTVFGNVVNILTLPFRTAFNIIADLWNATLGRVSISIPSWVPVIGGDSWSFPQMPHLQAGAIVRANGRGGVPVMLGDGNADEAIVPLNAGNRLGGGGPQIVIYQTAHPGYERAGAEALVASLERYFGTGGTMRVGSALITG